MGFVMMKIFEEAPRRFDRWMQVLTLGRLQRIRDQITGELVTPGAELLEIGCGTGSLLEQLAPRCKRSVGIDAAPAMVDEAQERMIRSGLAMRSQLVRLHALQIEDEFDPESFDHVVSILALSEMSDDEIDCLLPQCRRVLRSGGRLILVDEVEPEGALRRIVYRGYRSVSRLLTFLGLQAAELQRANLFLKVLYFVIELPLMLLTYVVVPPVTHPLARMEERIAGAGFRVLRSQPFLGGSLKLVHAEVAP